MDTRERIRTFILDNCPIPILSAEFEDHDSLIDIGLLDSVSVLELVAFIETQFGIEVGDEDLTPENLDSVDRLCAFVEAARAVIDQPTPSLRQ